MLLNCCSSFSSFSVDKVPANTCNFVSVILNVALSGFSIPATKGSASGSASLVALLCVNRQFSDHVEIRFISQLINGMFSVVQKWLKCFNGTTISTSISVLLPSNFPIILVL